MHTAQALLRLVLLAILVGTLGWVYFLTNRTPSLLPAPLVHGPLDLIDFLIVQDADSGVTATTILLNGAPYQSGQPLPPGPYTLHIAATNGAELRAEQTHSFVVGGVAYLPLVVPSQ
jgi:hypothetical protein